MTINKDSTFQDIIMDCPQAGKVLFEYGMHCIGCHLSASETLEQGAKSHGLNDNQIKEIIDKINKLKGEKDGL